MRSWVRALEASAAQIVLSGAGGGAGYDPVDRDTAPWVRTGGGPREVPEWSRERARVQSVANYRTNPMARAIIDTYTSFCVGDRGVTWDTPNPRVAKVVADFWEDHRNSLGKPGLHDLLLRDILLSGEAFWELMTGEFTGVVRFAPVQPEWITDVRLIAGNPLWVDRVDYHWGGLPQEERSLTVVQVSDATGLREGEALFEPPWKALISDRRGMPFLTPILDWLDSYDTVLGNLIDRTALSRYFVWDVTVQGGQPEVDAYVNSRGGRHLPPSASVEFHNDQVSWEAKQAQTGSFEDTNTNKAVLTNVASGAGLAKHWLSEPEGANRATSLSMAEPVRRRVQGVQSAYLGVIHELTRFAVDRAVAAQRCPPKVQVMDPRSGKKTQIPASRSVTIHGPEIAASDAEITAKTLLNLATGLKLLVETRAMSREAAELAARKAWTDYTGAPFPDEMSPLEVDEDAAADVIEKGSGRDQPELAPAGAGQPNGQGPPGRNGDGT